MILQFAFVLTAIIVGARLGGTVWGLWEVSVWEF